MMMSNRTAHRPILAILIFHTKRKNKKRTICEENTENEHERKKIDCILMNLLKSNERMNIKRTIQTKHRKTDG